MRRSPPLFARWPTCSASEDPAPRSDLPFGAGCTLNAMTSSSAVDEQALDRDLLAREVARRRTFAIISHPDAGKTTLTEKLLLYAGAIDLAGAVRGRKTGRRATSDWMEIEQQRGISISAAALEFEIDGYHVTLLDTPGHQDFSEDTYRTLLAVDSVVMVIDAAKGIEAQTLKLFEVCRTRRIPVLTFINKLDQPSRDPFELLDEIERVLGIAAAPMNWPLGDGADFCGVYDLVDRGVLLYERQRGGQRTEPIEVTDPADPLVGEMVGTRRQEELIAAVEIISGAGTKFDAADYRDEQQTPVFFGSALNDFGVEPFLKALLTLAPSPRPRPTDDGLVTPTDPAFSGFVFKIQANMNPRHRDRVAFFRICSGRLTKDMMVRHERLGTTLRLARVYRFFGRDRETVPEAYPGDVVGLVSPGQLAIGDTLYDGKRVRFPPIPIFPAERFATLRPAGGRHKKFDEAVRQLAEEGLLQLFFPTSGPRQPIIGVVGALQFDVIAARMGSEYGIPCEIEPLAYVAARWPLAEGDAREPLKLPYAGAVPVTDPHQREALLFASEWALNYCIEQNPRVRFRESL
jgi:peptide chain release factor 3